jgi:hypothetical protein
MVITQQLDEVKAMRWIFLVFMFWSTSSLALYECRDSGGVLTFRDTPCPSTPNSSIEQNRTKFRVSAESARLATQIRLGMRIDEVKKVLGEPLDSAAHEDKAWYRYRVSVAEGVGVYEVDLYAFKERITSISDDYRRLWARGKVWRGIEYEDVLWTWGEPSEITEKETDQGLERTLIYDAKTKNGSLDTVRLVNDEVMEIEYDKVK